jgi:hypothetical protein
MLKVLFAYFNQICIEFGKKRIFPTPYICRNPASKVFKAQIRKSADSQNCQILRAFRKFGNLRICDMRAQYFIVILTIAICGTSFICKLKFSATQQKHNFSPYKYMFKILGIKFVLYEKFDPTNLRPNVRGYCNEIAKRTF